MSYLAPISSSSSPVWTSLLPGSSPHKMSEVGNLALGYSLADNMKDNMTASMGNSRKASAKGGMFAVCLKCDAGSVSKWVCKMCVKKCHSGHAHLPMRMVSTTCKCKCGHTRNFRTINNSISDPVHIRNEKDNGRSDKIMHRIFDTEAAGGSAGSQYGGYVLSDVGDRFTNSRKVSSGSANGYILDRQLTAIQSYVPPPQDEGAQIADDYAELEVHGGATISEDAPAISVVTPGTSNQALGSYQFFKYDELAEMHSNLSGHNLVPCGLTALSIMDTGHGAVIGGFTMAYLLAVLYRCSRGTTEGELQRMLGLGNIDSEKILHQVQAIDSLLQASEVYKSINIVLHSAPLRSSFSRVSQGWIIEPANKWQSVNHQVSQVTNGLIPQLLQTIPIEFLVIVNAIAFKSSWKKSFNRINTEILPFRGVPIRQIPMMRQTDLVRYMIVSAVGEIMELDYSDRKFCMGFILPVSSFQISQIMDIDKTQFQDIEVTYSIPRFIQRSKVNLTNGYRELGITELFEHPNLPYVIGIRGPSILRHEAVIIIDESGTDVQSTSYQNHVPVKTPIQFILNRSFYYYIRHIPTNTFVLMGHYV